MLVADLTKTAHIVVGHLIGDKPPEIPKETVGHVLAADHHTTHDRDERHRIVAVGRDEILDQLALLHKTRGISVVLVSHSMEDIAKYVERIIVMNHGHVAFDDTPKKVFAHYKELEKIGLAAPQMTYIMHALKEHGMDVDVTATTVEEARDTILAALESQKKNGKKGAEVC